MLQTKQPQTKQQQQMSAARLAAQPRTNTYKHPYHDAHVI
jgi:hypothetical protein